MTDIHEGLVKKIHFDGTTPEYIQFQIEAPPDLPQEYRKQTDRYGLERLGRLTDTSGVDDAFDIGRVSFKYEGGWEIAWGELQSRSGGV